MEALVSSIIEQLAKVIVVNASQELRLVTGVEKEVEMLKSNLKEIGSVLKDAEQKQMVNLYVRLWIKKLKEVAYDMDDVLDEWNTAILKLKIDRKKVSSFLSCFAGCLQVVSRQVVRRHDIAIKIKEINLKVDVIAKDIDYQFSTSSETQQLRPREATSFVDVSNLHGRDEVKNEILRLLLGEDDIQTISIVGMRGIGKTALAQLIFNDDKVQKHFNKCIWVSVSDLFDQYKIALAILGSLGETSIYFQNLTTLEHVLNQICEKIGSGIFLLVLDDLWKDDYGDWEPLKAVFRKGRSGSKILVTTHKKSVATGMGISEPYVFDLEELSDEVCWVILSQEAFVGRDNERQNLEDIGMKIAKKCKGLPHAAKTLGVLLRKKNTRDEWQEILDNEIWEEKLAEKNIFEPLLLSYYDMPSHIRPCLLYCAIFPKDFDFLPTELIKHWMAHGYLRMKEKNGEGYFKDLVSHSFFQDFEKDSCGNIIKCKMHGIVHDFVRYLTKEEIVDLRQGSLKKARHLRVTIAEDGKFPESIDDTEKLRSLVTNGKECDHDALQNLFKGAKCLRLLEFAMDWKRYSHACVGIRKIPNEIRKLIHLRYLNFSWSSFTELPEEVCELHNLQYLNLCGCKHLKKLPKGIGKLINLRSLNTRKCNILECYPKGIGGLTSLTELTSVKATVDGNDTKKFSVGDMEKLDLLCGDIEMILVGDVFNDKDAERAKLCNKPDLKLLSIDLRGCRAVDNLEDVREALKPPEWLIIERYDPEE